MNGKVTITKMTDVPKLYYSQENFQAIDLDPQVTFQAEFSDHRSRWGATGFGSSVGDAIADLYRDYEKKDKSSD